MKTHEKEEWTTQELVLRTLETARDHIKQYREYSEDLERDITDLLEARLLFHWFMDSLIHESQRHEFR